MGDRARQVPREKFIAAWNAAGSLDDVVERVKELAGGRVPRRAVLARAALRMEGVAPKSLRAVA